MKKVLFLITLMILLTDSLNLNAQIQMNSSGYVSVGNISPATNNYEFTTQDARISGYSSFEGGATFLSFYNGYNLSFGTGYAGYYYTYLNPSVDNKCTLGTSNLGYRQIYSYSFNTLSDLRNKENVRAIGNGLNKIMALNGVRFDYKPRIYNDQSNKLSSDEIDSQESNRKNHLGFIAQDVNKILPEVVSYDDSADIYTMDYTKIIPVLVEAIKEQQTIIAGLKSEIQELKNSSVRIKLKSESTPIESLTIHGNTTNNIFQNSPNPFSQSTTIEYSLAENVQNAMICIYDMNGMQLKCIPLHLNGYGNITINGSELKTGMYMYSLIADGQLIDTKRMILTD